jgi:hypothetical protein
MHIEKAAPERLWETKISGIRPLGRSESSAVQFPQEEMST